MLQGDFLNFDKTAFSQKLLLKWLDNVYSCTQNASSKINVDYR